MIIEGQRKEIRELLLNDLNDHEFSRFILALDNLIKSDDWFRIAAVHGATFLNDDKEILCSTDSKIIATIMKNGEPIYSCHNDDRFVIWHRVYLREFELLLRKYDVYPNNKNPLMLPYLDWLNLDTELSFINEEQIQVYLENNELKIIKNPLYSGRIYDYDITNGYTNKNNVYTVRNGTLFKDFKVSSSVKREISYLLNYPNYEIVSSNYMTNKNRDYTNFMFGRNSLEIPHNYIHVQIGGTGGAMINVQSASYDPIFWLHHSFIEKIFYTWQVKITNNGQKPINDSIILLETLDNYLPPFFNREVNKFCWQNNTGIYTTISEWFDHTTLPYCYDINSLLEIAKPRNRLVDFLEIFDLFNLFEDLEHKIILEGAPVPLESCVIELYLYDPEVKIDNFYDEKNCAGKYYWFGINRKKVECERCQTALLSMIFNITEWINSNDINPEYIKNYVIKLRSVGENTYFDQEIIGNAKFKYLSH
jgi:hypothetical protein